MTIFLGIYRAIYQYEPQSPEELAIDENDLLYLLQKSDVDDWWTVKKRVIGADIDEPSGLVPNNYIEEAPVIGVRRALYDYLDVQNPDEEMVFHENDTFDVFDDRDPDWVLCRSQKTKECGFVPGNYIEAAVPGGSAAIAAPPATSVASSAPAVDITSFPPPPQHVARSNAVSSERLADDNEEAPPIMPSRPSASLDEDDEYHSAVAPVPLPVGTAEEAPPSKPSRPMSESRVRPSLDDDYTDEYNRQAGSSAAESSRGDGDFQSWEISEVDGRKKRKAKLAIGRDAIYFTSAKNGPQQWDIKDLMSYDNEKKHIFLEFSNPYANIEIHTGTTDIANEIIFYLSELKGASKAHGLREVEEASKSSSKKQGKIVYDFIGESRDELSVKEGDIVNILNDRKSEDWWMCELVSTGQQGVIPAQFVEPMNQLSFMAGTLKKLGKVGKSSKNSGNWKDDEEQDGSKSAKKSSRKRGSSILSKKKDKDSSSSKKHKDYPDSKKTRIWVDRSGTFKVEAEFIGCHDGKIHLHKANGVKIAVAADKLSPDDLIYVERTTGMSLDKYKPKTSGSPKSARDKERERRRKLKDQDEREREKEERERERRLRERELEELRKARDLLDKERASMKAARDKDLPPIKPPRPNQSSSGTNIASLGPPKSESKNPDYDWFEFFLNCGVDVNNCQRYAINFEREQIAEEILPDIQPSLLRTLGLREGDIIRVMKFLDQKFGREKNEALATGGGLFSESNGALKVSRTGDTTGLAQNLLPQQLGVPNTSQEDDAWTVKPAVSSATATLKPNSEFSGSMQDLLDLQPLEPKKTAASAQQISAPQPNLQSLESVKTGNSIRQQEPLLMDRTGASIAPLDPFKTGGNNLLPMATGGFVMVPVATGGLIPFQRTGGLAMPQTTFGMQPTGTILPVQKTGSGLVPVNTGGFLPQTTFGMQNTGGPMQLQTTGGALPSQPRFLGGQSTGGFMPSSNVMPVQNTAGLMPLPQTSFNQPASSFMQQNMTGSLPLQRTGGGMNFAQAPTGFQQTGTANFVPSQFTGGMTGVNMGVPQTSFNSQISNVTGNYPLNTFGSQMTGGANYGNALNTHATGGMAQGNFNAYGPINTGIQMTGGGNPSLMLGGQQTGGFQPQSQFGLNLQRTGGMNTSFPQTSFNYNSQVPANTLGNNLTGGVNQINNMMQNTSLSQAPLQTQPTGFGFGNGPQPQGRQANLYNASADNPFGF
ncbi:LAMI_0D06326g1_1 [Lachancea mirantina]|uniref:Actin cytoskeleton-regulatory complex protein SLA1 n=1 Tax=Lachancea mirantina TaxID=1230905 RepID=A0A1G4JBL3_9SACH|nr:LAMI_0D06326g1_1 [Lachancea mirantina]